MVLSRRRLLQGSMICAAGMMQAPSTAATLLKQRILMVPNTDFSRAVLASALGHLGEIEEARRVWNELMAINSHYTFANHYARQPFANKDDVRRIGDGLDRAGVLH